MEEKAKMINKLISTIEKSQAHEKGLQNLISVQQEEIRTLKMENGKIKKDNCSLKVAEKEEKKNANTVNSKLKIDYDSLKKVLM